jgi:hypothetical protein
MPIILAVAITGNSPFFLGIVRSCRDGGLIANLDAQRVLERLGFIFAFDLGSFILLTVFRGRNTPDLPKIDFHNLTPNPRTAWKIRGVAEGLWGGLTFWGLAIVPTLVALESMAALDETAGCVFFFFFLFLFFLDPSVWWAKLAG